MLFRSGPPSAPPLPAPRHRWTSERPSARAPNRARPCESPPGSRVAASPAARGPSSSPGKGGRSGLRPRGQRAGRALPAPGTGEPGVGTRGGEAPWLCRLGHLSRTRWPPRAGRRAGVGSRGAVALIWGRGRVKRGGSEMQAPGLERGQDEQVAALEHAGDSGRAVGGKADGSLPGSLTSAVSASPHGFPTPATGRDAPWRSVFSNTLKTPYS